MKISKHELWQSAKVLFIALFSPLASNMPLLGLARPKRLRAATPRAGECQCHKPGEVWRARVANFIADSVTVGASVNSAAITSPKFCISSSCITAWPSKSTNGNNTIIGSDVYSCPVLSWNNCRFYCNGQLQLASTCRMGGPNNCGIGGSYDAACTLVGKIVAP